MTKGDVLYFIADKETYRFGKIGLLSAKSSVLKSREAIKSINELRDAEKEKKKRIVELIKEIDTLLKKYIQSLPKTHEEKLLEREHSHVKQKVESKKEEPTSSLYKDEISQELDTIQEKLKSLGAQTQDAKQF